MFQMKDRKVVENSVSEIDAAAKIDEIFNQLGFGFSSVCYLLVALVGELNQPSRKRFQQNEKKSEIHILKLTQSFF